ncbi:ribokinase [Hahella sp. CCB-MM4]|uniref:ribokinase n=1 Tax=Hahella sp. (strain CCB-MM4) TaxID=1926491 RepID=UPI000B9AA226|nr:ribokinase [Hahella sp. CCB-MM4]OZG73710.1 ribokinase [Hahella sp. CCB-MM4]
MKVLNFGSINIDKVYQVSHFVRPGETLSAEKLDVVLGGKGANQSIALARAGVQVKHFGAINRSDGWIIDYLAENQVDTSWIELVDSPSGHAIIQVDQSAENSILLFGGANRIFSRERIRAAISELDTGDWLLLQNECNGIDWAIEAAREQGVNVAFNPAPMTPEVSRLPLDDIDLLFVNQIEAADLAGTDSAQEALRILNERYAETTLVMTLGAEGALLSSSSEHIRLPAKPVKAVDTTGAGDTFVGFFLASIIQGLSHEASLNRAITASSIAVTRHGASPSIPYSTEVTE